jgi:hypothetical protein
MAVNEWRARGAELTILYQKIEDAREVRRLDG